MQEFLKIYLLQYFYSLLNHSVCTCICICVSTYSHPGYLVGCRSMMTVWIFIVDIFTRLSEDEDHCCNIVNTLQCSLSFVHVLSIFELCVTMPIGL